MVPPWRTQNDSMLSQPNVYSWVDWPATRLPFRAFISVIIIAASALWAYDAHPAYGVLALLVLSSSAAPELFPSRFTLSPAGVQVSNIFKRSNRPWSAYDQATQVRYGVFLRYRSRVKMLQHLRSVLLRCPSQYDDVVRYVAQHVTLSDKPTS